MSWEFLTESLPFSMMSEGGGFLNGADRHRHHGRSGQLVSIPLGILAAVYLVEYGKGNWLAKLIRFFSDVMTGVPIIFVGVFVYTALVIKFGYGALMGAASLALIMMPIIVRSSEEMLKLVPHELKDASYALGAAKWQTMTERGAALGGAGPHHRGHAGGGPRGRGDGAAHHDGPRLLTGDGQADGRAHLVSHPCSSTTGRASRSPPARRGPGPERWNCW